MSIPVAPTPILNGKNAKRFDKLVKQGLKKPVKFVPTPGLEDVKKKIAMEREIDYKKAFEMLQREVGNFGWRRCANCPKNKCTLDMAWTCADKQIANILQQCTKGGE
jgi:hypothetical protein